MISLSAARHHLQSLLDSSRSQGALLQVLTAVPLSHSPSLCALPKLHSVLPSIHGQPNHAVPLPHPPSAPLHRRRSLKPRRDAFPEPPARSKARLAKLSSSPSEPAIHSPSCPRSSSSPVPGHCSNIVERLSCQRSHQHRDPQSSSSPSFSLPTEPLNQQSLDPEAQSRSSYCPKAELASNV